MIRFLKVLLYSNVTLVRPVVSLLGLVFIFFSCTKHSRDVQDVPLDYKDSARIWFDKSGKVAELNGEPNWNAAAVVIRSGGKRYIEVPIVSKRPVQGRLRKSGSFRFAIAGDSLRSYSSLLIHQSAESQFKCFVMKVVAESPGKTSFGRLSTGFTGMIYYTTLKGGVVDGYRYADGMITHKVRDPRTSGQSGARLDCTTITIDYYQQVCVGAMCSGWSYIYSTTSTTCTFTPEAADQPYDPNDPGGGGGGGGGEYYWEEQQQIVEQVEIDTVRKEITNPCVNGIFTKVTNDKLKSEMAKLFRQTFVVNGGMFNLTIRDVDQIIDADGSSIPAQSKTIIGSNEWQIAVSREFAVTAANEYMATAVLHELIHSFIWYYQNTNGTPLSEFQAHKEIIVSWVEQIRDALIETYGMNSKNATSLALQGIDDVILQDVDIEHKKNIWRAEYDNMARTNYGVGLQEAYEIAYGYQIGVSGTKCP